jgi:hypothetical protein
MALQAKVRQLREHITDEVIKILGLPPGGWTRSLLGPLVFAPAPRFSEIAAEIDQRVAEGGLPEAARWALGQFRTKVEVALQGDVPSQGPLLIASNHPGAVDGLAIAASLKRPDLKIIATSIPFIRDLPTTARHLIYTPQPPAMHGRMAVVRSAIRHLEQGGALLIFPSGQVDPDPAVLPGADQALERWSPSVGLILKALPETQVLIGIVSGVISPAVLRHPLARLRGGLRQRQLVAEYLQIVRQILRVRAETLSARLTLYRVEAVEQLAGLRQDARQLTQDLVGTAQRALADHLARGAIVPQRPQPH